MAIMNFLAFVALLLMSVNAQYYDPLVASQLLVTPIEGQKPNIPSYVPIFLARDLLKELKLFNLMADVVQARHDHFNSGLIFQMSDSLQADQVVKAWSERPGILANQMEVHRATKRLL